MEYQQYEYAGFFVRLLAFIIDVLLSIVFVVLIDVALDEIFHFGSEIDNLIFLTFFFLIPIQAWFLCKYAASPGKMLFRLRVVDAVSGENLTFLQASFRYIFSIIFTNFFPAYIWIWIDRKNRAWHDLLFRTVVILYKEPVKFK